MSAAISQPIPEFYTWGVSGAPIQIQLSLDVVRKIRKQIEDSEKASGLLSACGLLTGSASKPGIAKILDFRSLRKLDASVEAATGGSFGEVVGFYLTIPTGSVWMPDEERALATRFFRQPNRVFLLVETGKSSIGDARFCFWGEGELFDWSVMPFPFDAEELAIHERRRLSRMVRKPSQGSQAGLAEVTSPADEMGDDSPETQALSTSEPLPVSTAPEPAAKRRKGTGSRRLIPVLATVTAASVLAGAFMYVMYFRPSSNLPVASPAAARAEVKATLGLAVEKRGDDLVVSWNRNAAMIAKADFGMLLIRGSEKSRDVPLSAEELRTGSVVYASPAEQVRFQLNVVAGEEVAREFLAVVLPQIPERPATLASSQSVNSKAGAQPRPVVLSVPAHVEELKQFKPVENRGPAAAPPPSIEEPPSAVGAAPANGVKLPLLTQPVVTMPGAVDIPAQRPGEAPTTSAGAHPPVATHSKEFLKPIVPADGFDGADSSFRVRVEPVVAASHRSIPLIGKRTRRENYVPPTPLRNPGLTDPPHRNVPRDVNIDVKVYVNPSGKVDYSEAVSNVTGADRDLAAVAVFSARRWEFVPARDGDGTVPGEVILHYLFGPGARLTGNQALTAR